MVLTWVGTDESPAATAYYPNEYSLRNVNLSGAPVGTASMSWASGFFPVGSRAVLRTNADDWSIYDPTSDSWSDVPEECAPSNPRVVVPTDHGLLTLSDAEGGDGVEARLLVLEGDGWPKRKP